jgi:hypothetical protein
MAPSSNLFQSFLGSDSASDNVQHCTSLASYLEYGQAMMNCSVRSILKLGPHVLDLCASSVGCFVFTRGFRSLAMEKEGSVTGAALRAAGSARRPLADSAAALFLLAFVTTEALATIRALAR